MKKTAFKLVIAVQGNATKVKRSSRTISNFINKIPCSKDFLEKPTQASIYVQREMRDYPVKKIEPSSRQIKFSEKLQQNLRKNTKQFNKLISQLQIRLSFLDLEEMTTMIKNMKRTELIQNKTSIKKLESNVLYKLQSSQGNDLEDHVISAAETLINEIKELHKKKAFQIV